MVNSLIKSSTNKVDIIFRERRKSTGRHFYPYTEEDVGALGASTKLRSASTTQAPVTSVYKEDMNSSRQNSQSTVTRHAETFESEHESRANSEANHEQTSVRKTSTNSSHNRYTVSSNVRTRDLRSSASQPDKEGNHDRGREMMERRRKKEADESQVRFLLYQCLVPVQMHTFI